MRISQPREIAYAQRVRAAPKTKQNSPRTAPPCPPCQQGGTELASLDKIDLRLLAFLQEDATLSTAALSRVVGITQSHCWRRIQRLRDGGIIKRAVTILDHARLGFDVLVFAQFKIAAQSASAREAFFAAVEAIPEIQECWTMFGDADVMMRIVARDPTHYHAVLMGLLTQLPDTRHVRSQLMAQERKSTRAIPLSPPPTTDASR